MKIKRKLLVCSIALIGFLFGLLFASCSSSKITAPSFSAQERAVMSLMSDGDVHALIDVYNSSKTSDNVRMMIEDALFSGEGDLDLMSLPYENTLSYCSEVKRDTPLSQYLDVVKTIQEAVIVKEISDKTVEDLSMYVKQYPKRKDLVLSEVNKALVENKESMSYLELNYVSRILTDNIDHKIMVERDGRKEEVRAILTKDIDGFFEDENELMNSLYYSLEKKVFEFYRTGCGNVSLCYSKIGMIPDNTQVSVRQFQKLVNGCMKTEELRSSLQKETDRFCKKVNEARAKYVENLGSNFKYTPLSIKIPAFNLNYQASEEPLQKVIRSREHEKELREKTSKASSIVGLFGFGIAASIGKGIVDWVNVSDMASEEVQYRREYMGNVFRGLDYSLKKQSQNMVKNIKSSVKSNQSVFKKKIVSSK